MMELLFDKMTSFLSKNALGKIKFASIGENVLISKFARFYKPENIKIKSNVRIDDFCIVSAGKFIEIGNNVHIASHCGLWGNVGIRINDFSGISSGSKLYSESDDFSGKSLTGPTVPAMYRKFLKQGIISIGKHVVIGANSTVLPGIQIGDGCTIGCNSVVNKNCDPWKIYAGCPIKLIRERSKELLILEKLYLGLI